MLSPFLLRSTLLRTQVPRLPPTFRRYKSLTAAIERGRQGGPDRPGRPRTQAPPERSGDGSTKTRRELRFERFGAPTERNDEPEISSRPRRDSGPRSRPQRDSDSGPRSSRFGRVGPPRSRDYVPSRFQEDREERPSRTRDGPPRRQSDPFDSPPERAMSRRSGFDRDRKPPSDRFGGRERSRYPDQDREPRRERYEPRGDRAPRGDRPFDRDNKLTDNQRGYPARDTARADRGGYEGRPQRSERSFGGRDESSTFPRKRPEREQTGRYAPRDAATTERTEAPKSSTREPESLPYTTAASEFIYGHSSVVAAMKAGRRKFYNLYVHSRGANRDGLLARIRALKLFPITNEVGDEYLRAMDKASSGRPHNGVIMETSPLPVPPITELKTASLEDESFTVGIGSQSTEDVAINGTKELYSYKSEGWRHPLILYVDGVVSLAHHIYRILLTITVG
jgi:21S rRNA (GM2251-2'-O)-methyltransferase